jgi:hypothetical protein
VIASSLENALYILSDLLCAEISCDVRIKIDVRIVVIVFIAVVSCCYAVFLPLAEANGKG